MAGMWDDPLNDISRPLAVLLAGFVAPAGSGVGVAVALLLLQEGDRPVGATLLAVGLSVVYLLSVLVWYLVMLRGHDRKLSSALAHGNHELVTGAEQGQTSPGRVVRVLPDPTGTPVGAVGMDGGGPGQRVLATVLAPEGARRVAALVPASVAVGKGHPLPLVLHPRRREVAVLDARVPQGAVDRGDQDPRWSGPLPTSSSVTGGWSIKLLAMGGSLLPFAVLSVVCLLAASALG